ncbi:PREDICTED: protein POLAR LOCALIZATION DURING ASYMMETRIC DIVISION AND REDISTRIBUTION [Prunus mume]|uniref:Protein POLAR LOCALIZATION DURING ASYMMETRIC DIVISION AND REDISTRIBUTION n=1 Tax=Prunus mume TaxID=102107 RepID=A0ABM1LJC0_PRUMU|nr:PREDICTED: protein POLAR LOCALIZATION DURING ASYMMETRIC DIVISION AND REDISTRIBUTION [Prunus mume]
MWQAVFAAAVAASTGLLAKNHIFNFKPATDTFDPTAHHNAANPIFNFNPAPVSSDPTADHNAEPHPNTNPNLSIASAFQSELPPWEISDCEEQPEGTIFRFSSEGRGESGTRFRLRKGTRSKKKKGVGVEAERSNGAEQRRTARKVGVCLKKRKTGKSVAAANAKCGSSSSADTSLFNWGLNVGIMYMMSAGKAEINKLNTAMDETARIVHELKSELHKRKSPQKLQASGSASEDSMNDQTTSYKLTHPGLNKSSSENRGPNDMRISSFPVSDGECASSVLTEEQEPEPEVMDMDQLEAELESELQKLPWCITEAPRQEGLSNLAEDIVPELEGQGVDTQQFHGVLPAQLDQKLCHVLIEQQESQIVELESELHSAQSKLQEKETELQSLKDCVRRLTELSLSNVSDDETEARNGQEQATDWNYNMQRYESTKPTVGMKRPY